MKSSRLASAAALALCIAASAAEAAAARQPPAPDAQPWTPAPADETAPPPAPAIATPWRDVVVMRFAAAANPGEAHPLSAQACPPAAVATASGKPFDQKL